MTLERGTRSEITAPMGLVLGLLSIFNVQLVVARTSHGSPLILILIGLLILVGAFSRFKPEMRG